MTIDQIRSMAAAFAGVQVFVSDHLPCKKEFRQVRFPKTKGKRIRKKWAKNKRKNWRSVDVEPVIMQINGQVYCNALGYTQIKRGVSTTGP